MINWVNSNLLSVSQNLKLIYLSSFFIILKINISEWKDVSFGDYLDVDIDRGLEIKILYNPAENSKKVLVRCYFCNSQSNCRDFELKLDKGRYEYHGCTSGFLHLPEVEENKTWILKIYKRKTWLMMDLDGVNRLKLDTIVESCSETWTGHISKINFDEVSQDVVTHYRIAPQQDFTGKIYLFKLSVS